MFSGRDIERLSKVWPIFLTFVNGTNGSQNHNNRIKIELILKNFINGGG